MLTQDEKQMRIDTINGRLKTNPEAAVAQCERFCKHIAAMHDKAAAREWGEDPADWPGDAPRTHADLTFYVETFDKLHAVYA